MSVHNLRNENVTKACKSEEASDIFADVDPS